MADPNQTNPQEFDNLQKIADNVARTTANMKDEIFGAQDAIKQYMAEFKLGNASLREALVTWTRIRDITEDTKEMAGRLGSEYISQDRVNKLIRKTKTESNEIEQKLSNILMDQTKELRKHVYVSGDKKGELKNEDKLYKDITKKLEDAVKLEEKNATLGGEANIENRLQIKNLSEILNLLQQKKLLNTNLSLLEKDISGSLDEQNDKYEKSLVKGAALKKVLGSIANIPIIGPLINWQKVADKTFGEGGSTQEGLKELKKQVKDIFSNDLVKGLLGAAIFSKLIDLTKGFFKIIANVNEGVTKLSNNLGISNEAGEAIYNTFSRTSRESLFSSKGLVAGLDTAYMSIRNMVEASNELRDSLGTNAFITEDRMESEILLTKQMKFTNEEAAGFQRLSAISGKTVTGILQTTLKQNNAGLSYRKILKEVSQISAELSMRLGNDPERIAKAVVQANKLGLSLEETRKISDSLLNFESSIEGELESELLLGKQFNFEKARELALMGKSSEAAADVLKQIGGINELEKMNVIQRERVANAIGLSADELSKAATQEAVLKQLNLENKDALEERIKLLQEQGNLQGIAALKQEAAKVAGGEVLIQDIAKASLADKYAQTMEKLQDIMSNILAHSTALKVVFSILAGVAAAIATSMMLAAVASIVASGGMSLVGAIGTLAAVGAGVGILSGIGISSVSDSVISPSGQVMISTPKGGIIPDKNDSIITTTNPQGLLSGGNNDGMAAIAAEIQGLHQTIKKGGNVYIDSVRSGMAYGMSYNSYA